MGKVDGKTLVLQPGTTDNDWTVVNGGMLTGDLGTSSMDLHLHVDSRSQVILAGSVSSVHVDYINGQSTIDLGKLTAGTIQCGKVDGQCTVTLRASGDVGLTDGVNGQSRASVRIDGVGNVSVGGWIDGQSTIDLDLSGNTSQGTPIPGSVTFKQKIDGQSHVKVSLNTGNVTGDLVSGNSDVNIYWSASPKGTATFKQVVPPAYVSEHLVLTGSAAFREIPESHVIKKLVQNPADPPDVVALNGHIGAATDPANVRLYGSTDDLNQYLEVQRMDVQHARTDAVSGQGAIFVKADAKVRQVTVTTARAAARARSVRPLRLNREILRHLGAIAADGSAFCPLSHYPSECKCPSQPPGGCGSQGANEACCSNGGASCPGSRDPFCSGDPLCPRSQGVC